MPNREIGGLIVQTEVLPSANDKIGGFVVQAEVLPSINDEIGGLVVQTEVLNPVNRQIGTLLVMVEVTYVPVPITGAITPTTSVSGTLAVTSTAAVVFVQIAFSTNPTSAPTWVDVTPYVRHATWKRGRQHELDRSEAGTATITLDNRDRRFDPTNAAGPYYPNVLPMRRVQILSQWQGITYDLFTGFIESWPMTWPGIFDGVVELQATDGFKVLSLFNLNTSYPQQLASDRVQAVLDDANWTTGQDWILGDATNGVLGSTTILGPVGDRAIDQSETTVQAQTLTDNPALSHLQDVESVEQGAMYVNAQGKFVFHNRTFRAQNVTSQAVFGGGAGELPYHDLTLSYDDTWIWNVVRVTPTGGTPTTVSDATSKGEYFPRTKQLDNLPLYDANGSEAAGLANYLLRFYKQPALRVEQIEVKPAADARIWPHALGRELDDVITVHRTPQSDPGGATIEAVCRIEGIEQEWSPQDWTTRWQLSPTDSSVYWILGDPVRGVLGSTTIPYY